MTINSLLVSNFKGISERKLFDIKPITIVIGPNSSGKSSCIHALATLAQTIKLGDTSRALTLDDEFAQVHLGRFIEIVHSKSYTDSIEIGVNLGAVTQSFLSEIIITKSEVAALTGDITVIYTFKSTKRTQEVYVHSAILAIGTREIRITATKSGEYLVTDSMSALTFPAMISGNFFFELGWDGKADEKGWISTTRLIRAVQRRISHELRQTAYLGPFRQSPIRRYPFRGSTPFEVGAQGEAAISLLANEYMQSKTRKHTKQISGWLEDLGLAKGVKVSRVGSSDLFDVSIQMTDDASLPIADLGYGLSQILPVLVQCSFAKEKSTLLFEQPELHLHEGAAKKLAKIFTDVVSSKDVNIVAETHSRDLFFGVMNEIREGHIAHKDVIAYDVKRENGCSAYTPITMTLVDNYLEVSHPWGKALET